MRNAEKMETAKAGLTKVTSRTKQAFFALCVPENTLPTIASAAKKAAETIPAVFVSKKVTYTMDKETYFFAYRALLACGLAYRALQSVETLDEYVRQYAIYKCKAYKKLSDYGAFGDFVETLCHIAIKGYFNKVNMKNVHVSDIGKIDFTFCGNKVECGINGKTWREGIATDFSAGKYNSVVYGMINSEKIGFIVKTIVNGDLKHGIIYTLKNLYYFPEKTDFFRFIETAGKKSALIQYKQALNIVQTIYNDSTEKAFLHKVSAETFYNAILTRYPQSDILKED